MIENTKEESIYQRLVEAELQNRLLSERLNMMTQACNNYTEMWADICQQMTHFDLDIDTSNRIIRHSLT